MSDRPNEETGRGGAQPGRIALRADENAALKGLLVLLVVLSHDVLVTRIWPGLETALHTFHVWGFLLLPFLRVAPPLRRRFVLDRAVRHGVPHVSFLIPVSVLFLLVERHGQGVGEWLLDLGWALLVGSAAATDAASGFRLYWFLPALFSLVIARSFEAGLSRGVRRACFVLWMGLHAIVPLLPPVAKAWTPLGLLVTAYVLPLGLLLEAGLRRWGAPGPRAALAAGILSTLGIAWMVQAQRGSFLGTLSLAGPRDPLAWLAQDATPLLAFVALLGLRPVLARSAILRAAGRHSLVVFLAHSPIFHALARLRAAWLPASDELASGLVLFAIAALAAAGLSVAIHAQPRLRAALLPRDARSWRAALKGKLSSA